ncbi:MAG: FkbM family methyltransferase [Pseudomonadota bacterium]
MVNNTKTIQYSFPDGKIGGTGLVDGAGMYLMKAAAILTSPMDYVGLSWANRIVRTFLPSSRDVITSLSEDTKFAFPYGDAYWGRLLGNNKGYAPDIEHFLKAMQHMDYCFIDCGANYGYLSALVTSDEYGNIPTIAIEADPNTFKVLEQNAELNQNRFELLNRAIFSKSGDMVQIHGAKHEARSILSDEGELLNGNVETLALAELVDWVEQQNSDCVILKLDIEGVEIEAMKGLGALKDKDLLILYEDHASDPSHEVSQYFLNELGMEVFVSEMDKCRKVQSLEDIAAVKKNSRVGYDFIATNSSAWLNEIQ